MSAPGDRSRIVMVAAERVPLAKVGGLADVAGALSDVLAERGHEVMGFLPAYRSVTIPEGARRIHLLDNFPVPLGTSGEPASVEKVVLPDSKAEIYLVDHLGPAAFFQRSGIYGDPDTGHEYPDNAARYLFFCRAVCETLKRLGRRPDVIHLNDYQTAFVAAFLRQNYADDPFFRRTGILFSIHNMGYQGIYMRDVLAIAGVPRERFHAGSPFEFYGRVNFLKVGLELADLVTTVSPRYAIEIQSGPEFGYGLEGVLRARGDSLWGILNGIDDREWNPATDSWIAARYSPSDLTGKHTCKVALEREAGWPEGSDTPIVGMITRLVDQKGFDLLEEAGSELSRLDLRLFVLGTGQPNYHEMLERWSRQRPDRVRAVLAFDNPLAHRIEAGADLFLMPSRYEPSGLNQMMSQRYGTAPVVRATGGLVDTVEDFDPASGEGTGFVFKNYDAGAMLAALRRALALYRQPNVWERLMKNAMARDFSWGASASRYEEAYAEALRRARERRPVGW